MTSADDAGERAAAFDVGDEEDVRVAEASRLDVREGADGPLDIGIVRYHPARQGCRIGAIPLTAEDGQPAVGSLPEHDVVVAISALEDPPVGARDGSPILGKRR